MSKRTTVKGERSSSTPLHFSYYTPRGVVAPSGTPMVYDAELVSSTDLVVRVKGLQFNPDIIDASFEGTIDDVIAKLQLIRAAQRIPEVTA